MNSDLEKISKQWDLISNDRFQTLKNKEDQTYETILKPAFISRIRNNHFNSVLDVGCGLGFLTKEIGNLVTSIVGIDISVVSLDLASSYNALPNVSYVHSSVEDYQALEKFDLIIANMVLMDMADIQNALSKIYQVMEAGGAFIFTITHPAFWPVYWEYAFDPSFNYNNQIEIITDFKIRGKTYTDFKTSHFHRPISDYLNLAISSGFIFVSMSELYDRKQVLWYPRFLLVELKK